MSEIGRTMPCWECNGSGVVADEDKRCVRCPACDDGWLEVVPAERVGRDRDASGSGARRALSGEGTGMSGVVELAEQLAVAVDALEDIYAEPEDALKVQARALLALRVLRGAT